MAELARLHGEVGWRAHAFPISVDGIEVVASLVLLAHRRSGRPAGWLPWVALAAGTAASLAANVAVGASDPVGRLVAGWPAIALLVAIKLLSGLLDVSSERAVVHGPDAPDGPRDPGAAVAESPSGPAVEGRGPGAPVDGSVVPEELVTAARAVRDRLVAEGRPLTRRSLAAELRAAGLRVRNDRLGHLMVLSRGDADA